MFLYPNNLKSKPQLWLWELKDLVIIGVITLIAVFIYSITENLYMLVVSATYAILTIKFDDLSIMDFIRFSSHFFILSTQKYTWKIERNHDD